MKIRYFACFNLKTNLVLSFFVSLSMTVTAQNTTTITNPQTGVRVTTKVTPIPSLAEQVRDLEKRVEWAKTQPDMIQNGTLAKYEYALEERRKQLAEENAVRTSPIKTEDKK